MDTVPIAAASLGQVHVNTVRIMSQYHEPFSLLPVSENCDDDVCAGVQMHIKAFK